MEVEAAGAKVRAGQPLPAQHRAIGTAAHRHFLRLHTGHLDGFAGGLDEVEVGFDLLDHVAVAVLDLHFDRTGTILAVEVGRDLEQVVLLILQLVRVVVAQDIAELGVGDIAVHLAEVIESLPPLGGLRACHDGQSHVELHRHIGGVDHGILCTAGMDREAVDGDGGRSSVEVFVLDAAHVAAIDGVGKVCPEALEVEQSGTLADLLVGGEGDAELAVRPPLGQQGLHCGQDLGHAGLVICAQQGRAVGGDEGLALQLLEEGEGGGLHDHAGGGQDHIAAVVVFMEDGVDVLAAGIRCGVHVGDQTQCRLVLAVGRSRNAAVNVAVLVHKGIFDADGLHVLDQNVCKVKLPLCGGMRTRIGIRGGVHPGIF